MTYPRLSYLGKCLVAKWKKHCRDETHTIPNWDEYFLQIAFDAATRSSDTQTQHGAVIVSLSNEIISTGYNGALRNIDNTILPNMRPHKYDWMIHAEVNCILACARQGKSTLNTKIYVTGEPCDQCYQTIWQAGIKEVVYGNHLSNMQQDPDVKLRTEIFKWLTGYKQSPQNALRIRHIDFPK